MLCERCDQLRLDNLEKTHASCSSEGGKRVVDYRAFQDFAYSFVDRAPGFPFLEASEKVGYYDGEVKVRYRYLLQDAYIQGPKYPGALVVNVEPDDPSQQELGNVYVFSIHSNRECVQEWLQTIPWPERDALSEKSLEFINECLETPLRSEPDIDKDFNPTRLLDLGEGENPTIRLIITKDIKKQLKYAALSYCWGPPEIAKHQSITTAESLNSRLKHISLEELSPVIQDTIRFCRGIRDPIRYLWVDALCIIQRDGQDWQTESGLMSLIYKNAFVTPCSLGSSSCNQSFLARRLPTITVDYQSLSAPNIKGSYSMVLRGEVKLPTAIEMIDDGIRCANLFQDLDIFTASWLTRGWTFQEFHLSKRRLFIGRAGTHFSWNGDSNTSTQSEDGISTIGPGLVSFVIDKDEWKATLEKLGEFWHKVLYEYRQRQLTNETDHLPALAGLARWVADSSGARYLADIVDKVRNPFGAVRSGFLRLDGFFMSLDGTVFSRGGSSNDNTRRWNIRTEPDGDYVAHALLDFTPAKENVEMEKLGLLLTSSTRPETAWVQKEGLVIYPVEGTGDSVYRRVGVFVISGSDTKAEKKCVDIVERSERRTLTLI
ncbi:HET domain-containing protein [Fusarium keratoplasticum]|nr:HET domain-containing protein [Fusarium keratoplasticum]